MSLFRKKQYFLVSFFHDCSSWDWEDWDVPIDLTWLLADVSEYLLICAARRRQRGEGSVAL